jgi:uncharacterized protein (DUF885 family)
MVAGARETAIGCVVLLLAALQLAGCEGRATEKGTTTADDSWATLLQEWIESDHQANPLTAASQGRHEYDGLFPDWSEAGLKAEIQRLKDWRVRVLAVDAETLDDAARFQRQQLLAVLDGELFWREAADWPHRNPRWYYLDPSTYLDRPYADLTTRMKAYMRWASNVPRAAAQISENLKGPLPRSFIDIGMHSFGPLGDFLKQDVVKVFAGTGDAATQAEFARLNAAAAAALAQLQQHLWQLRATQTEDFAMGPKLFADMLKASELVDTPLAELEAVGRADLKRNQTALVQACKAYAPRQTIVQCVGKVNSTKPDDDIVAYATRQLAGLKQFVQQHDVASIPAEDEARVKQSPPYNAQNSAYSEIPGPYERNMPAFYNVTAPDPAWSKTKQRNYIPGRAELLFTSVHEAWPGHFLQFLHSNRAPAMFSKLYVGYAFAEGWAHYAEEMMWEEGLGEGDPEVHIGQLTMAMLRDVRLLSAIGLHTQGMTLAQSRQLFIDAAYQGEGSAEQQAARGAYDPAYLNYTMGKLMIRRLRSDWCGLHGGADDHACWRSFHDEFLSYGGPPIPLVRAAMMNEPVRSMF